MLLAGGRVVTPDGVLDVGWLEVDGGRISDVGDGATSRAPDEHLRRKWVIPGFVDVHCHGGGGADFLSAELKAAVQVLEFHRRRGTTMVPSLVTAPLEDLERNLRSLAELVQDGLLAGLHLEGPFLPAGRCGAHDPRLLRTPVAEDLQRLLRAGGAALKMVTLAPELAGGLDAVRAISDAGVVAAVGHSDADHPVALAAVDAGARVATHLFNGMRSMRHRDPGVAGALQEDPRVTVELIHDGVHLHDGMFRLVLRAAGADRVALVSAAMGASGLADGSYWLGAQQVVVRGGQAWLGNGRSLAGSTTTMAALFAGALRSGASVVEAVAMAASTPASVLGLADRIGALAPGMSADLVVLDEHLNVERVLHQGRWVR